MLKDHWWKYSFQERYSSMKRDYTIFLIVLGFLDLIIYMNDYGGPENRWFFHVFVPALNAVVTVIPAMLLIYLRKNRNRSVTDKQIRKELFIRIGLAAGILLLGLVISLYYKATLLKSTVLVWGTNLLIQIFSAREYLRVNRRDV